MAPVASVSKGDSRKAGTFGFLGIVDSTRNEAYGQEWSLKSRRTMISFVIVSFRSKELLSECVSALASQLEKGDEVIVIAGDHKSSKGKVLQVIRDKNRVIVEGVNMIKKHERKTQDNPQGSIIEREASIHYSNVKLAEQAK